MQEPVKLKWGEKSMRVYSYVADKCVVRREKLRCFCSWQCSFIPGCNTASVDNWSWHFEFTTLSEADPGDREVWRRLTSEIVDSNPAEGMDVGLLCLLCDVYVSASAPADHSLTRVSSCVCGGVSVRARARLIVSDLEIWTMRRTMPELRSIPTEINTLPRNVRNLFAEDQLHSLLNTLNLWECKILKAIVEIFVCQVLYINNYSA